MLKYKILISIFFVFLVSGCSGPNLPKMNDEKGLSELSIQKIADEFKLKKISENQYRGVALKPTGKAYYFDNFLSAYCFAKNNNYVSFFDNSNGNFEIKACKPLSEEIPIFVLYIEHEHFYNVQYDGKATFMLDFSDAGRNSWISQKKKYEDEKKAEMERSYAKRKAQEEEYQQQKVEEQKKVLNLRNKKGQQSMGFYNSWQYVGQSSSCETLCIDINKKTTGYSTLQEALNDGWKFNTNLNAISKTMNSQCMCEGSLSILEK